jgi:competence protein ComEA
MHTVLKKLCLPAALLLGPAFAFAGPVNINTADEATLADELDGVGPALAAAIVRDREENGPYESPEAIIRVRGIGERVLETNRENIRVKDEKAAAK